MVRIGTLVPPMGWFILIRFGLNLSKSFVLSAHSVEKRMQNHQTDSSESR